MTVRILDCCNGWSRMVSFTPRLFYPKEMTIRYPQDSRQLRPQSRSGHGKKENSFVPAGSGISIPRLFSAWPSRGTTDAYRLTAINRLMADRRDKENVREKGTELQTLIGIQSLLH